MKKAVIVALILGTAFVAQAEVVSDIKVKGLKRMEPQTVISYLPFKKGEDVSRQRQATALRELYKTGFFSDVKMDKKDGILTITVEERPVVSKISFEGNDKADEKVLKTEVQLKVRDVYTPTKLKADAERLTEIYRRMGMHSAVVEPVVEEKSRNRVEITFKIDEGSKNYVRHIKFKGNENIDDERLKEAMMTKERRWYRFLTSTDTYDADRLNYDKDLLRRFYFERGYIDFAVLKTEVSKEEKDYIISLEIKEGARYRVGDIDVRTTLKGISADKLKKEILLEKGKYYNAELLEETITKITDELGREGYAFVEVVPDFKQDKENKTVSVVFRIKEGERVFVNNISISGNSRTLDKVIRREFRLAEGDPFNTDKIKRSRQRIENLGYFDKVDFKSVPVAGGVDRTDIAVDVSEKSTGAFNVGIGWSTYDGLLLEAGIQERNFLGTGNIVGITASTSDNANQVDLSFTNPYFMDLPISAGFDIYHIVYDYSDDTSYKSYSTGGSLRAGWDYTEKLRQTVKYTLQQDKVSDVEGDASVYIKEQEGENILSMFGTVFTYDTRDSAYNPTEGYVASAGVDLAGIGGDSKFVRLNLNATQYFALTEKVVLSLNATGGVIHGLSGQNVRINYRYYLGGSTLRGFEPSSVGARTKGSDDVLGGDWRLTSSAQVMFPLGLPQELGFKGKFFIDAGMIGKPDGNYNWNEINYSSKPRVSIGTGLLWQSPMGPINIDFGFPIIKEKYDEKEVFRLSFGTGF